MWKFWVSRSERMRMDAEADRKAGRKLLRLVLDDLYWTFEDVEAFKAIEKKIDEATDFRLECAVESAERILRDR